MQDPRFSPAAYGDPKMQLSMQALLKGSFQNLESDMVTQNLEMKRDQGITEANNKIQATLANLGEDGNIDNAILNITNAVGKTERYLTPSQRNKLVQDSFSGVQKAKVSYDLGKIFEESGDDPVLNVNAKAKQLSLTAWQTIGGAGAIIGEDNLDILRMESTGIMEQAVKTMQNHNKDYLRSWQAKYENAINNGQDGYARDIQQIGSGKRNLLVNNGDLGVDGEYASKDWFMPIVPTGGGRGGNVGIVPTSLFQKHFDSLILNNEGLGGYDLPAIFEQVRKEAKLGYTEADEAILNNSFARAFQNSAKSYGVDIGAQLLNKLVPDSTTNTVFRNAVAKNFDKKPNDPEIKELTDGMTYMRLQEYIELFKTIPEKEKQDPSEYLRKGMKEIDNTLMSKSFNWITSYGNKVMDKEIEDSKDGGKGLSEKTLANLLSDMEGFGNKGVSAEVLKNNLQTREAWEAATSRIAKLLFTAPVLSFGFRSTQEDYPCKVCARRKIRSRHFGYMFQYRI
ncbi:MAG: hypothetical protein Ta2B_10400 [Termitinemataceae bacterium]|nr:MAG: hypothetical protein Ta2B_10400 [Termitinemataceae bacterium]